LRIKEEETRLTLSEHDNDDKEGNFYLRLKNVTLTEK